MDASGVLRDQVLFEWYRYPPGPAVTLPSHAHEEYQLNLTRSEPSGVRYRGGYQVVPAGSLGVLMPGEAHTPRDPAFRESETVHLTLYAHPSALGGAHFRDVVVDSPGLVDRFAALFAEPVSALAGDVGLLTLLADLAQHHGGVRPVPAPRAHRAVRLARDYLHDNRTANVSLAELATVSGLSQYHLTRVFTADVGLPPHTYQLALRMDHAKRLLAGGHTVTAAGHAAGFFDASHFTRHFKRTVGVSPGRYAR